MKLSATLSRYLAKTYIMNMLLLLGGLLFVVYLFDTVELIRRASKYPDIPLSLVLQMGLLKLPEVGQALFPFAILFGAMFTFWQLTRRYELIVVRAAGFSVWQFLAPIIGVALLIGALQITIINPIGALLVGKFEQLERNYLSRQKSQIALFKEGLWLRQEAGMTVGVGGESGSESYVILHAEKIVQPDWTLKNVMVLFFDEEDHFVKRINAPQARLEPGHWVFKNPTIHQKQEAPAKAPDYILPTTLTIADVEESFASPETMSFWALPGHIQTLEQTGFNSSRLRVHYHSLLAQPLMFSAMILLAAAVSMRTPRSGGSLALFAVGIFIGFFIFFMSSFLQALGASGQIPVLLAAWSPAFISFLLGLSVMMNLEDG